MNDQNEKPIYVGDAKLFYHNGEPCFSINVRRSSLSQGIKEAIRRGYRKVFKTNKGEDDEQYQIACFPLQPENVTPFKTHSAKLVNPNYVKKESKIDQTGLFDPNKQQQTQNNFSDSDPF